MLNIISRAYFRKEAGAVHKVARNLVAGLEELGVPFVINKRIDYCSRIWIHDDYRALLSLPKEANGLKPLLGPNLFVMPRDIPKIISIPEYAVYLQPSNWVVDTWQKLGYKSSPLDSWAVGIDSRDFHKYKSPNRNEVLFYYKHRDKINFENGANYIETILQEHNIRYTRINYGSYTQDEYLRLLGKSKYVIWYGRQESQGLALQEALAMECPVIVIDATKIGDSDGSGYGFTSEENNLPATSAPYFDERCGIKINNTEELLDVIGTMEANYHLYRPQDFIRDNLSLAVSAERLLQKYDKWWQGQNDFVSKELIGNDSLKYSKKWIIAAIQLRLHQRGLRGIFCL